jgi:hypothetical protein
LETLYSMSVGKKGESVGGLCRKDAGQVWFSPINTSEGPAINSGVEDRALFPDSTAYILPWNKGERCKIEFFAIVDCGKRSDFHVRFVSN